LSNGGIKPIAQSPACACKGCFAGVKEDSGWAVGQWDSCVRLQNNI